MATTSTSTNKNDTFNIQTASRPLSPDYSTRSAARAYAVGSGETPQQIEKAVANYDKTNTAFLTGFLLIPSLGFSWYCYDRHHTKLIKEKIDANFSLAKAIISAPLTPLSAGRYKFRAGGFVFTEVWYENNPRVMVIKDYAATSSATFEAVLNMEECAKEDHYVSYWELLLKRLNSEGPDPIIYIDGNLKVQDIQLRATNLIRTKAEMEAHSVFDTMPPTTGLSYDEMLTDEIAQDFIKLVGIFALAEALITPQEANNTQNYYSYVQRHIEENSDSVNTLKTIFGFRRPDTAKRSDYVNKCGGIGFRFSRSNVPGDRTKYQWTGQILQAAINCGFNVLRGLPYDSFEEINL